MSEDWIVPLAAARAGKREPLLECVLADGEPLVERSLERARAHCREQLAALPPALRALAPADEPYPVRVDPALEKMLAHSRRRVAGLRSDAGGGQPPPRK